MKSNADFRRKKGEEKFDERKMERPPNLEERLNKRKYSKFTDSSKKKKKKPKRESEKEKKRKDEEKSITFVPPNKDDPGTFSFYYCIGNILQCNALVDLGSCANILLLSMCKRRRLGKLKPANTILILMDSTAKYPKGIVEDVPVRVGNMTFLVDFIVLDTTEDVTLPVIFGRPFFATTNAIINVAKGEMELSDGHTKKKISYAAKINHQAPTPPIPDFVLEYVRRKKREYEEELSKEKKEEAERTRKKMEEDLRLPWSKSEDLDEEREELTLPPPPPTP